MKPAWVLVLLAATTLVAANTHWAVLPVVVVAWLAFHWIRAWRLHFKELPAPKVTGGAPRPALAQAPVPKLIWAYWHDHTPTPMVRMCVASWQRFASDHEIRLLHADTATQWLGETPLPPNFSSLPKYRQADWLRIALLRRHGGIWLDATTLLTAPLDWVHQRQQAEQVEMVGYCIDTMTHDPARPMVENWFIAAAPGSRFVADWMDELEAAVVHSTEEQYLAKLREEGLYDVTTRGIDANMRVYLIMHVGAAKLMACHPARYRLLVEQAEGGAYFYLARLGWSKRSLYVRMALTPCPSPLPPLIKFRGRERRVFDRYVKRGWVLPGSLLNQCIQWADAHASTP